QRIEEIDFQRLLEVERRRLFLFGLLAAEHLAEEVGEARAFGAAPPAAAASTGAAEAELARIAAKREALAALCPAPVLARPLGVESGVQALGAEFVVQLALGGVAQHVVGDRHVFEAFLGALVAGIHIGMQLARELAIGLSDLVLARPFRDAKDGVVVF